LLFPHYQSFVDQHLLGIRLPYQRLPETYSDRITTSASVTSLVQLLNNEIFPSLLVRQFVFLQVLKGRLKPLHSRDVTEEQLPKNDDIPSLITHAGIYLPNSFSNEASLAWIK